jgi:hypothetical protein
MRIHAVLMAGVGLLGLAVAAARGGEATAGDYRISGPYTKDNLAIFLIHGKDALPGKHYLTLSEALERKKAVVHETRNVNELTVENLSGDADLYLEAGDIVKGGQQDRVVSTDLILQPKSGKVPVACFCVEASRWRQRGAEDVTKFDASPGKAASKEVQLAAQSSRNQALVWRKVAEAQMRLGRSLGKSVQAGESPTSLQLSQEDKKLLETVEHYVQDLAKAPEGRADVIGYAAAINGKVENADIYGSSALFAKLWPRLLGASAIEAVAALQPGKKFEPATSKAVVAMLADAEKGQKKEEKDVAGRVHLTTRQSAKHYLFETRDQAQQALPVHKSYK